VISHNAVHTNPLTASSFILPSPPNRYQPPSALPQLPPSHIILRLAPPTKPEPKPLRNPRSLTRRQCRRHKAVGRPPRTTPTYHHLLLSVTYQRSSNSRAILPTPQPILHPLQTPPSRPQPNRPRRLEQVPRHLRSIPHPFFPRKTRPVRSILPPPRRRLSPRLLLLGLARRSRRRPSGERLESPARPVPRAPAFVLPQWRLRRVRCEESAGSDGRVCPKGAWAGGGRRRWRCENEAGSDAPFRLCRVVDAALGSRGAFSYPRGDTAAGGVAD
jgi:hypothetical protein